MEHKAGRFPCPSGGTSLCWKTERRFSVAQRHAGVPIVAPAPLYEVAQDIFGKSHNQLFKLRNFVAFRATVRAVHLSSPMRLLLLSFMTDIGPPSPSE